VNDSAKVVLAPISFIAQSPVCRRVYLERRNG
jgi:hypothetical protein